MSLSTLRWLWLPLAVLFALPASAQSLREAPQITDRLMPPVEVPRPAFDLGLDRAAFMAPSTFIRTGGPDAAGYTFIDSDEPGGPTFGWVDISGASATPGTAVTLADPDDGISSAITLPFSFTFYGVPYSSIRIGANGAASFTAGSIPFTNASIPNSTAPNQLLAPFWDDLHMGRAGAGSEIRYRTMGDGRFVISWINAKLYNPTVNTSDLDFQIILEQDGDILFQYLTLTQGNATSTLASATTGIEGSGAAGQGLLVNFNTAGYPTAGLAIRFVAPPPPPPDVAFASVAMTSQSSGTIFGDGVSFWIGSQNNVVLTGTAGTLPMTSVTFDLSGSSNPGDIVEARLYSTGSSTTPPSLASPQFGTSVLNPGTSVTFTGTQPLPPGNNYFWLIYRISGTATPGSFIQNVFTSVTVDGVGRTPTPGTLGNFQTLGTPPVNNDLEEAKVVLAVPYTDTQSNAGGSPEPGEAAASCVFGGAANDPGNSIWYAYTPGSDGTLVTTSRGFDTIHTVYTGTTFPLTEVGCSDDFASTGTESVSVPVTAETTYYIRVTGFGGAFGSAIVTVNGPAPFIDPAAPAEFTLTPATVPAFGPAGACIATTERTATLTVTNTGGSTLAVTGTSIVGDAGFFVDGSSLPASLASTESVQIPVGYTPPVGADGPVTATVTIAYNDGTAQTADVALSGTAIDDNLAIGEGAGIEFGNNDAVCNPQPAQALVSPLSADFVPVGDAVKITDGTPTAGNLDDGFYAVAIPAPVGSIRAFGRTYSQVFVNTNGLVTLGSGNTDIATTLPTTTGNGQIAVAKMDLNFAATYNTDNTGVAGSPGIYVGAADVDGDEQSELVITYWHAYDFGSPGPADPARRYVTAQLIVFPSGSPNEDDVIEIRYPGGNDANGIPFQFNSATGGSPTLVNDVIIGLSPPTGGQAAAYRQDGSGGSFDPEAGFAVRFEPQTQAVADGGAGWRMMGAPVAGYTVGRLADLNLVQSVIGQYPDFAIDNVLSGYDGTAFAPAANVTDMLARGRGFLWYLFDQNLTPDATADGGGSSRSYALPMALQGTGSSPDANVTATLSTAGDKFNMIANPFRTGLNIDPAAVATWTGGADLTSAVFQTWDPVGQTYTTMAGDVASAWQGFWAENNTAASLTIPTAAQVAGGTFEGRGATRPALAFELAGTALDGTPTLDRAARVALFDAATDGWDLFDASKLSPLTAAYATIGLQGVGPDGATPRVKAQDSRPTEGASFSVPMVVDAVGTASAMTLSWNGIDTLPAAWRVELRDLVTGTVLDLRAAGSYAFEHTADPARTLSTLEIAARTTTAAQAKATSPARFELVVTQNVVATEGTPVTAYALAAAAPNPVRDAARVRFALPEAGAVSVGLYDLLGRRVATLAESERGAGWHEATVDARALSAGVYVVRMEAGTFVQSQRLTVVR